MKGKVLVPFIDKHTLKGYSVGNVYESNDSKRIAFLREEGYLEVKDIPKEEVTAEPKEEAKPKRKSKKKAGE